MVTKWSKKGRHLRLSLSGELGHREALAVMAEMPDTVKRESPSIFEIDMKEVSFTDSSGIAVLIQGKKLSAACRAGFFVTGARPQAMKVFRAAGIDGIIEFKEGKANEKADK